MSACVVVRWVWLHDGRGHAVDMVALCLHGECGVYDYSLSVQSQCGSLATV